MISPSSELDHSLQRVHLAVLGVLAVCALVIGFSESAPATPHPVDRAYTWTAVVLALGAMLARRLAGGRGIRVPAGIAYAVVSLLLAGAIGVVGVAAAASASAGTNAIAYPLGGAFIAMLRPRVAQPGQD